MDWIGLEWEANLVLQHGIAWGWVVVPTELRQIENGKTFEYQNVCCMLSGAMMTIMHKM